MRVTENEQNCVGSSFVMFLGRNWQVQICVGSSPGVFCVGNLARANLSRVFVWGVFSGTKLASANLCRVFVWGVFWCEAGRCKFV